MQKDKHTSIHYLDITEHKQHNQTVMPIKQAYQQPQLTFIGDLRQMVMGASSGTTDSAGGGPFAPIP